MGPNEAVLPTMVPVRACEAASAACARSVLRGSRFLRQVDCCQNKTGCQVRVRAFSKEGLRRFVEESPPATTSRRPVDEVRRR